MRLIHLAVTGTQQGGTLEQYKSLEKLLRELQEGESWLHHGDCIGVDQAAHDIARAGGWKIRIHPPTNPGKRAFCNGDGEDFPRPYLKRNIAMVRECLTGLIAIPQTDTEVTRSGTWATVRYARKLERSIWVIWPNGFVSVQFPGYTGEE